VRARSGISLLEVMVAVTVLGVGLLALAAATASFTRFDRDAAWEARAAAIAHDRLERLAASCVAASGTATAPGLVERWRSVGTGPTALASVTVATPPGTEPRERRFEAPLWCAGP
jgi:prepilin-type N-terminal cleavage/methylation domain-containing protein